MPPVGLYHFLLVAVALFAVGLFGLVTRRNAIVVLMCVELILNAAALNFVAFSRYTENALSGQMAALFIIVIAAAEAAIALAIVLNIYRRFSTIDVSAINTMKE